jgi:dTMP kinase
MEQRGVLFHEKVRAGFLQLAAAEPQRFRVIDAARHPDLVWTDVQRAVEPLLRPLASSTTSG